MITRTSGYLTVRTDASPAATGQLHQHGFVVLDQVFTPEQVAALRGEVKEVFDTWPADERSAGGDVDRWAPFRYEMLNRSAACQHAIGHPRILETIEPLLGEDCHVIANTAWWQHPRDNRHLGRFWHIDSGPHVPRPPGVPWDDRIPYPVFAVATHIFLAPCPLDAGPTGVIPGSHRSGSAPPFDRLADDDLEWEGKRATAVVAEAGDVALFVSDIWHRRLPPGPSDPGRMFIQCHYGRRDLAQRLRTTAAVNHLSDEAIARAQTTRQRTLVGLHPPGFYDG